MTREEHAAKIDEIIEYNNLMKRTIGLQNTRLNALRGADPSVEEAYQRGLNDAWECARKIALNVEYDVSAEALRDAFNVTTCYDIFIKYSAQEAIKIIEEYEKQKYAIKKGDEVALRDEDRKAVIMDAACGTDDWYVFSDNACIERWSECAFYKTGRTFPQIEDVLKAMQEGTES